MMIHPACVALKTSPVASDRSYITATSGVLIFKPRRTAQSSQYKADLYLPRRGACCGGALQLQGSHHNVTFLQATYKHGAPAAGGGAGIGGCDG